MTYLQLVEIRMKKKKHSPEQIVRKLRKADHLRAEGKTLAVVVAELGISQPTYTRWRNQYGAMTVGEVKRLKALEKENARLKGIVADQALDISMLKEVAQGNW
jgi:predicted ATPase